VAEIGSLPAAGSGSGSTAATAAMPMSESAPAVSTTDYSQLTMLSISQGEVLIKKAGTTTWVKAQVGTTLEAGDAIKTATDSWAVITFFEGSTIELEPGTEVGINELNIDATTGSTHIGLAQQVGRTVSRVQKLTDSASSYEVETPTSVGAVRGSTMYVDVLEDGTTIVGNEEGDIRVTSHGKEIQIPPGQQSKVEKGKPPGEPKNGLPFIPSEGKNPNSKGQGDQGQDKGNNDKNQGQGNQGDDKGQGQGNEDKNQGQGGGNDQDQGDGGSGQGQGQDQGGGNDQGQGGGNGRGGGK